MAKNNSTATAEQPALPANPPLKSLDRLVGKWIVAGPDIDGTVTFEWMEGGAFLVQQVDLTQQGHRTKGVEYIGYDKESQALKSHYFDSTGEILEYEWEVKDDDLTEWNKSSLEK